MSHVDLTREEQELLIELLQVSLPKLEIEIERTDTLAYKDGLKHRRTVLRDILDKLTEPVGVVA